METGSLRSTSASERQLSTFSTGADSSASGIRASGKIYHTLTGQSQPITPSGLRRTWSNARSPTRLPSYPQDYLGLKAGFVKPAGVAWYASHHHTADGLNQPYQYSYLFAYSIDVNPNERTLVLPDDNKIRILAISVAHENPELKPAQPLFDTLNQTKPLQTMEKALP